MLLAFLSVFFSASEILYLDHAFRLYEPPVLMSLFYLFSFLIVGAYSFKSITKQSIKDAYSHKKNLSGYIAFGAAGNVLWFTSLFLVNAHGIVLLGILQRVFLLFYSTRSMNERMTAFQYILSGIIMLCTLFFAQNNDSYQVIGIVLCSFSYALFAISQVFEKKVASRVEWTVALTIRQFLQCGLFFIIALIYCYQNDITYIEEISKGLIIASIIGAVLGGVFGKITRYMSLKDTDLSRVLLVEQFKPIIVFIGAFLFLNTDITLWQLSAGIVMIISMIKIQQIDQSSKKR